jgi:hypothetical protein
VVSESEDSEVLTPSDPPVRIEANIGTKVPSLVSSLEKIQFASGEVYSIPEDVINSAYEVLLSRTHERKSVEVLLKRGFQFNVKEQLLVIPVQFIQQDATIAEIMLSCAKLLGFKVTVYHDDKLNCNLKSGFDDFFLGILYAIGGPRNTKLAHSKTGRELAYAIGMSLRVKGEAKRWNVDGALRPNNFFFANNPNEAVMVQKKTFKIEYGVRNAFLAPFESVSAGTIFYKVVSSTLMHIGIYDMEVKAADTFFYSNLITFDDFVKKNWVEIWTETKSKKLELTQVRKATFPNRNALLLNEELEMFKTFTQPFFSSVEDLRKDYLDLLMSLGYSGFSSLLAKRFGVRHTILQNIASVTTKRLQAIRKVEGKTDIKKKQVTRDRLVSYLSKIPSPLLSLRAELGKLLNSEQRTIACSVLGAELGVDSHKVIDKLMSKIVPIYINNGIYKDEESKVVKMGIQSDDKLIQTYEITYKKVISMKNKRDLIFSLIEKIHKSSTPEYRGMLYRKVYETCTPYITQWRDIEKLRTEMFDQLLTNMAITSTMLSAVTFSDLDKNKYIFDFCEDFKRNYEKTSRNKTLDKTDDQSILALVNKWAEHPLVPFPFRKKS